MTHNKKAILIVEDDPWGLKLMKGLLEIEGFEVFEAVDSKSALEILREKCPDFILIDIFLPGMNGLELLKKIKENKRFDSVKTAAISGMVRGEEIQKLKDSGFDHFISKPFGTKSFVEDIELLISNI